jgi:uncharacterized protein (TIGR03083 family)
MAYDWQSVIFEESASLLEAVRRGPLDARVPGCPDWSLAELCTHIGFVQRWATFIMIHSRPPKRDEFEAEGLIRPRDPAEAASFFEQATGPLVAALAAADVDAPCWNFTGTNQTAGFWRRRQALEVAFHRWDAESAAGTPSPLSAEIAVDLVDEFITILTPRAVAQDSFDVSGLVGDVHVHCTDVEGEWTFQAVDGKVEITSGHGKAAAAIRGTASDLALFLYHRARVGTIEQFGDTDLIDSWMSKLTF